MSHKPEKPAKSATNAHGVKPFVPFTVGAKSYKTSPNAGEAANAARYEAALDALKVALAKKQQISDVLTLFFDSLGEDTGFMRMGTTETPSERVQASLQAVAQNLFPDTPAARVELRTVHLAEKLFWHGSCTINGKPGTLLFFEDLEMGVIALMHNGAVKYARFTLAPDDEDRETRGHFHGRTPGETAH